MPHLTTIRPKLRQTIAFQLDNGNLLFTGDGRYFLLKGRSAVRWFSSFGTYLDGTHTLEELCRGMNPTVSDMIVKCTHELIQQGILKDASPEDPALLAKEVYHYFRPQIEFIDHYADTPQQRFKDFRESRILLVGSGEALIALGNSLLNNGLRDLLLAPTDTMHRYREILTSTVDNLRQHGIEASLSLLDASSHRSDAYLDTYDIVVYCSENGSLDEIFELNQKCLARRIKFLPAHIFNGKAFIGPLVNPTITDPCWFCGQMRLAANSDADSARMLWQTLALKDAFRFKESAVSYPVINMLGNSLSFELFKVFTGITPSEDKNIVIVRDIETLASKRELLVKHPRCPFCSLVDLDIYTHHLLDFVVGVHDHPTTSKDLLERSSRLMDSSFGLFGAFQDDDIEQIPLRCTKLSISTSIFAQGTHPEITMYSPENVQEARYAALLEAVCHYSMALPDARSMLLMTREDVHKIDKQAIAPEAFLTWSGIHLNEQDKPLRWLPAFSLFSENIHYVPAAAAYPYSELNSQRSFEKTLAGFAVGSTFRDVQISGMLSALTSLHIEELLRMQSAVIELTQKEMPAPDPDLTFLLTTIQRFPQTFTLLEVVHSSPVHIIIVYTKEDPEKALVTLGYGLSGREALKMALHGMVARLQAQQI
ncbi:TOMM precursor leader peptide-binding protein, partial [Dictyobacter arantiisoli]|uniref:TOMM precursor leader peptide-binding protein n=1 Tax=Dictyobacter arantiisoli TaxID=2014874 RepID=UPI0011EC1201